MRLDRVKEVVEWAREQDALNAAGKPSSWYQDAWAVRDEYLIKWDENVDTPCGTAYCIAGHIAVEVLGGEPVWSPDGSTATVILDGHAQEIDQVAKEWLGLDWVEATSLFSARNKVEDLDACLKLWEEHYGPAV